MKTIDSTILCPICKKGTVVLETDWTTNTPEEMIPVGPGSSSYFSPSVLSIHCANPSCMLIFHAVPGHPHMREATLQQMRDERDDD